MKKAKIMLVAIAVVAIVGGALAFKVRTFQGIVLCTKTTLGGPGNCTTGILFHTMNEDDVIVQCYFTTYDIDPSNPTTCTNLSCVTPGSIAVPVE